MSEADGEYKRTVYHRECSLPHPIQHIYERSANPRWNEGAILKPRKDSSIPKNYRPISLLCQTYKLYERMTLNRIAPAIEQHLIKEQACFRSGKSCSSQLLNLTQHIEDGYEESMITGPAFADLSAAHDTVNHRLLIQKLYNTTLDSQLCRVIQNLLSDRS